MSDNPDRLTLGRAFLYSPPMVANKTIFNLAVAGKRLWLWKPFHRCGISF